MEEAMELHFKALAPSRSDWENLIQKRLSGAFGEFCKLKFAEILKIDHIFQFDHWDKETQILLGKVEKTIFDIPTKSKFDRRKLLQTILNNWDDLEGAHKIRESKNEFGKDVKNLKLYAKYRLHIDIVNFSSEELMEEMLTRFSPAIVEFLKIEKLIKPY